MPYSSYIMTEFRDKREYNLFNKLNYKLKKALNRKSTEHVLIGNLTINGNKFDAIYINNVKINVIVFDDHGGELQVDLNNPWIITKENSLAFIPGTGNFRNPYHQVKALRLNLIEFLRNKENSILRNREKQFNWEEISSTVLFLNNVIFDKTQKNIINDDSFSIETIGSGANFLLGVTSFEQYLSEDEISNLLIELGINKDKEFKDGISHNLPAKATKEGGNLSFIHRLLNKSDVLPTNNDEKKILEFYKTSISCEKILEEKGNCPYLFPFEINEDFSNYTIDLHSNKDFVDAFNDEKSKIHPRNLIISLAFPYNGNRIKIFKNITLASDYPKRGFSLTVDLNEVDLFTKELERKGLPENILEDLDVQINNSKNLAEKINKINECTGLDIKLGNDTWLYLGFSDEANFTIHLINELHKLKSIPPKENNLFYSFLFNEPIKGGINTGLQDFIMVSNLNASQEMAIKNSFKKRLSVITGPPGTGKTQVVINILANAIINNISCLFASKNNKAVDNVVERLEMIIDSNKKNYILKLGSKEEIKIKAKTKLDQLLTYKNNGAYKEKNAEINNIKTLINKNRNDIKIALDEINSLPEKQKELDIRKDEKENKTNDFKKDLKRIVQNHNDELKNIETEFEEKKISLERDYENNKLNINKDFEEWKNSQDENYLRLFLGAKNLLNVNQIEIIEIYHIIDDCKKNFISRLHFKWFKKRELTEKIREINNSLPIDVQEFVNLENPWINIGKNRIDSMTENLAFILQLSKIQKETFSKETEYKQELKKVDEQFKEKNLTAENNLKNTIKNKKVLFDNNKTKLSTQHEKDKSILERKINRLSATLSSIELNKEKNLQKAEGWKAEEVIEGRKLLNAIIEQKLYHSNSEKIKKYIDSIPSPSSTEITGNFLNTFKTISITNLTVNNSLPLSEEIVDLLIIDEASQCDIASALPLIYRAKRIVVLGDPLQLTHITKLKPADQEHIIHHFDLQNFNLNYVEKSLYDYCFDLIIKSGLQSDFLAEHYRCHPEIIEFSNRNFYERILGQAMTIKTSQDDSFSDMFGIHWNDVEGKMDKVNNYNRLEVEKCINIARGLSDKYPGKSLGIITPFKDQKNEIIKNLPAELKNKDVNPVKVDTVHNYQGDEKDIIIFSSVVANGASDGKAWFVNKDSYLINVAITRARNLLIIVGDHSYCRDLEDNFGEETPLSLLAKYVEEKGKVIKRTNIN